MQFCMFCGKDPEKGDHTYCRGQLELFRQDLGRFDPSFVMQLAEHGHYGFIPQTLPTDWMPRARQLREAGLSWRKVARTLNAEGFKSKQGHSLDATLIVNGLHYYKQKDTK